MALLREEFHKSCEELLSNSDKIDVLFEIIKCVGA